ncbi:hypothetical protein GQ53DRAFT_743318 [Thozetella sp. PMI_491]|nr:hypothetical protein GQ53DRAFT_743318 [Thozetella sp. PMI_491]
MARAPVPTIWIINPPLPCPPPSLLALAPLIPAGRSPTPVVCVLLSVPVPEPCPIFKARNGYCRVACSSWICVQF